MVPEQGLHTAPCRLRKTDHQVKCQAAPPRARQRAQGTLPRSSTEQHGNLPGTLSMSSVPTHQRDVALQAWGLLVSAASQM